jgi:hypothetical protein
MWHAMFVEQLPVAEKILRTALVYALISVLFRPTGKRALGTMNTFAFVVIFLLAKASDYSKPQALRAGDSTAVNVVSPSGTPPRSPRHGLLPRAVNSSRPLSLSIVMPP